MLHYPELSSSLPFMERLKYDRDFHTVIKNIKDRQYEDELVPVAPEEVTKATIKEIALLMERLQHKAQPAEILAGGWIGAFGATNAFLSTRIAEQVIKGNKLDLSSVRNKKAREIYAQEEERIRIIYAGHEDIMVRQTSNGGNLATVEYSSMLSKEVKKSGYKLDKEGVILDQQTADILLNYFLKCLRLLHRIK
jgi:hypothetical protein